MSSRAPIKAPAQTPNEAKKAMVVSSSVKTFGADRSKAGAAPTKAVYG